ncbi:hypothetical protein PROFUN_00840 [Planoprotostelium fungivorum]|uniref:SH2 domain-containing protein n=1 Tax=Planoprotostelium fungivorum TaxID=1890364 RepID=A0A2P6P038_9EUKA|nr:hypothetical protein PROFUN_00840 [Planoprotostelium fungivorum]
MRSQAGQMFKEFSIFINLKLRSNRKTRSFKINRELHSFFALHRDRSMSGHEYPDRPYLHTNYYPSPSGTTPTQPPDSSPYSSEAFQMPAFTITHIQEDNYPLYAQTFEPAPMHYGGQHSILNTHSRFGNIRIVVQPNEYQVVNYNIFPAPEIEFVNPHEVSITVAAFLVYCDDRGNGDVIKIKEGFTNGDIQVLKAGQTRIAFPALHLSRMTPIKATLQHHKLSLGPGFAVLFEIEEARLISTNFNLVSACNRIPDGMNVRPRKNNKEKEISTKSKVSTASTPNKSTKRRAVDDLTIDVTVRGEGGPRGFIVLGNSSTLQEAREEIQKSPNYPKTFRFWYGKVGTIVQPYQEETMKVQEVFDANSDKPNLLVEPFDVSLQNIDKRILDLWAGRSEDDATVPVPMLLQTMYTVYRSTISSNDPIVLQIINVGVSHFFANTSSKKNGGGVTLDDFKLFLKFFGTQDIFNRVKSVYQERYFHGFARHSDAVELLKGRPGYFLFRYSESQLRNGYYAFNVNKGSGYRDIIENYSLPYSADSGMFIFRGKEYASLNEFINDADYKSILVFPLEKVQTETLKEPKYKDPDSF